ncbi:MAG: hypothetical protein U0234_28500 [Sandaracinus sp.]
MAPPPDTAPVLTDDEYRRIASQASAIGSGIVGVALALAVESSWGRSSTGATPGWVAGVTMAWLVASIGYTSFFSTHARFAAPVSSERDLEIYATVIYCSVFGATSSYAFSPAYAFLLAATINLGWLFAHRRPLTLAIVALIPVAMRGLAVPEASLASYAYALGAGVLVVIGALLWGRRCDADHAIRLALEAEAARLEAQREAGAGMRAAMSLHDGLSGAVLVLQAHLVEASAYEAARPAVRAMVGRVRALVEGALGHPIEVLETELPRVTRWLDARCTLHVDASVRALGLGERRDLGELAWESAMNALRRGRTEIRITLDAREAFVELRCEGRGQRAESGARGGGRGLRYAAARVLGRGGTTSLAADGTFTARWPRNARPSSNTWMVPTAFTAIFATAMLIGEASGHRSALWLGGFGALGAAGAYAGMASSGRSARAELDRLRAESLALAEREVMRGVRSLLIPASDALALADDDGSLQAAREAALELGRAVTAALELLEEHAPAAWTETRAA